MTHDPASIDAAYGGATVLITGGMGFIGSNLAHRLVDAGATVTLVDSLIPEYGGNPFNVEGISGRVRINVCDVRDPFSMGHLVRGQDFLFNLAGQTSHLDSMSDPLADLAINTTAQVSLLEACRKVNPRVRLVFASTRQIYGKPDYLPVDERHPVRPVDVNGINKLAGEQYHLLYSDVHGIRACALRLTNTYGPRMRVRDARQTFLGVWIRRLIEGQPFTVYGDGAQLRDFTYVDDCVDALLLAGSHEDSSGRIFNLGSREVVSLARLAAMLVELNGSGRFEHAPFPPERRSIDVGDYHGDHRLASGVLGWEPRVGLSDGLRLTLDYYREHHAHYWD